MFCPDDIWARRLQLLRYQQTPLNIKRHQRQSWLKSFFASCQYSFPHGQLENHDWSVQRYKSHFSPQHGSKVSLITLILDRSFGLSNSLCITMLSSFFLFTHILVLETSSKRPECVYLCLGDSSLGNHWTQTPIMNRITCNYYCSFAFLYKSYLSKPLEIQGWMKVCMSGISNYS